MRKIILLIFLTGFLIRVFSVLPYNTVIGFDQARDLWDSTTIFRDLNIRIIGPTAGNNPYLHHGVAWLYFMIPPLIIFRGNPVGVVVWNSFFSALLVPIFYFFAMSLFKNRKTALISSLIVGFSYYYVQFSGWLSNPTVCLFTVPVFFFGLWEYYQWGRNPTSPRQRLSQWGLPLAFLFLGLTIEFELFFIYLIPTFVIAWIILRPKLPSLKLALLSVFLFALSTSTMILTEVKDNFAGVKGILGAGGGYVGGAHADFLGLLVNFLENKWEAFYLNFVPQSKTSGVVLGVFVVGFIFYEIFKNVKVRKRNLYLLLIFFSPAIMLILGTHNAPWFLIGRPASVILMTAYLISKLKLKFLIGVIVAFVVIANISAVKDSYGNGQVLLEPDPASLMSNQLKAIDYTYLSSDGDSFEINSLTNPLYVNAVWSYNYYWYGSHKYGYLPTWGGGRQLYPYDSLPGSDLTSPIGLRGAKYLYLLIDTTFRIPPQYKKELIDWADKKSKILEEKYFGGIYVQKRIITSNKK